MKACIISIGDELLLGQTQNTNAQWLVEQLAMLGIPVHLILTVGDDIDEVTEALSFCAHRANIVITTGGLGPTNDDITRDALANFLNLPLVLNHEILNEIKRKFAERNRPFTENNVLQAMLPLGATALANQVGMAPGIYAIKDNLHIFAFPGVPSELYDIFLHQALPILKQLSFSEMHHFHFLVAGTYESYLSTQIKEFEKALPETAKLAYLPSPGFIRLRISCNKDNIQVVENLIDKQLVPILEPYLVNRENKTLEETLFEELKKKNLTIGTCESCTGGFIAHRITSVPGSSAIFKGSIISYANEIKEKLLHVPENVLSTYGAVSEETVKIMAQEGQKLLNVDICLAVSGIAGPDGGTPAKPVGYTWGAIALASQLYTYPFQFGKNRLQNIQWATYSMLFEALKLIRQLQ